MKAVVQERYGSPADVLACREIEAPTASDDEVLVRVRASSVHPDIWHAVSGVPYALRLMGSGVLRPKVQVPGMDLAGTVEAIGSGVEGLAVGDDVFGLTSTTFMWTNGGSFAEYAAVPAAAVVRKPAAIGFAEAAAIATPGYIAQLNLRAGLPMRGGTRILINGAAGGVGSVAVQIAKAEGAFVTGVDSTEKLDLMMALGADQVIDFLEEDVSRREERWDFILDVASTLSLRAARRILTRDGVYVFIGHDHFGRAVGPVLGSLPRAIALMLGSLFVRNLPRSSSPEPGVGEAMQTLAGYFEEGTLTPSVDRAFPLEAAAEAICYLESERALGRIVVMPWGAMRHERRSDESRNT